MIFGARGIVYALQQQNCTVNLVDRIFNVCDLGVLPKHLNWEFC